MTMFRFYFYVAALTTLLFILNPRPLTRVEHIHGVLLAELVLGAMLLAIEFVRAARISNTNPLASSTEHPVKHPLRTLLVFVTIVALWLLLYRDRWLHPRIMFDDNDYLRSSATWELTRQNLFMPYNDHLVVPTRLVSYLCVRLSDESTLPFACSLVVIPLFLLTLVLLFFFARREWRSDAAGLLAVALFSLTTCQREIIQWYSASIWLTCPICLLGSLLLIGDWRTPIGSARYFAACALCFLAPFSFSISALVGPITSMGVLCKSGPIRPARRLLAATGPTLATLLAMSLIVPRLLRFSGADNHVVGGGRAFGETMDYLAGVHHSLQLSVDLLFLRNLGVLRTMNKTTEPTWHYTWLFPLLLLGFVAVLRLRPSAWRIYPFFLLIVLPYAITVPARTWVNYGDLVYWSRYQMLPQLGVALLLTGSISHLFPNAFGMGQWGLRAGQVVGLMLLAVALFSLHAGKARARSKDLTPPPRRPLRPLEMTQSAMIGGALRGQFDETNDFERFRRWNGGLAGLQHAHDCLQ